MNYGGVMESIEAVPLHWGAEFLSDKILSGEANDFDVVVSPNAEFRPV